MQERPDPLVRPDDASDATWARMLAEHLGVERVDLSEVDFQPSIVTLLPARVATQYKVIPLSKSGAELTLAVADDLHEFALDDIEFMTGYRLSMVVATRSQMEEHLSLVYPPAQALTEPWVPKKPESRERDRPQSSRADRLKKFLE